MSHIRFFLALAITSAAAFAAADLPAPAAYRDVPPDVAANWKPAEPADAQPRGEWWQVYHDPVLDQLETRALNANQDLRAAVARVDQARAAAGIARSSAWPQVAVNGSVVRERTSATTDNRLADPLTTTYRAPLVAAWELDLFGRVRHLAASARAEAEASVADFEGLRLVITADVAENYFALRALERESAILADTVGLRRKALDLVSSRRRIGTASELDVARAETELAGTEAEASALASRRAARQNALAVLVGAAAPDFQLAGAGGNSVPVPNVPAGLPSSLLERRPDIAAAERALAAAHERIGVAKAAFFPAISLTGSAGYASGEVDRLFRADSRIWSIGPSLYLPIFQGGRNRANLERSRAVHEEAVAAYRQRVLVGFREVQDALTATRHLAEQGLAQERALGASRRATSLAQTRYEAGLVSYLDVIDAQRTSLAIERASVQLAAQRLTTSVALIKALGGGWTRSSPHVVAQR